MQFKFKFTILALVPVALAMPNPEPVSEASSILKERSCTYDGCTSEVGAQPGTYCGFCKQVLTVWNVDDIYQVNGQSGSGSCCDYGASSSCEAEWPRVSPNVLVDCADTSKGY